MNSFCRPSGFRYSAIHNRVCLLLTTRPCILLKIEPKWLLTDVKESTAHTAVFLWQICSVWLYPCTYKYTVFAVKVKRQSYVAVGLDDYVAIRHASRPLYVDLSCVQWIGRRHTFCGSLIPCCCYIIGRKISNTVSRCMDWMQEYVHLAVCGIGKLSIIFFTTLNIYLIVKMKRWSRCDVFMGIVFNAMKT